MTNFGKQIGKLLRAAKKVGGDKVASMVLKCWEGGYKFHTLKKGVEYAEAVDDVVALIVLDGEGNQIGWFGIESANYDCDIFDIVYDYSDNEYCAEVMGLLR